MRRRVPRRLARRHPRRGRVGARASRARCRQALRRRGGPAPRLRPLGRALVDARHDGHDPQSRTHDANGEGTLHALRRALRAGLPAPLSRDVQRRRAARAAPRVREGHAGGQAGARRRLGHGAVGRGPPRGGAPRRADRAPADGPRLPGRSARTALGRRRGGVPVVGQRPREDVPQAPPHPRRLGHRGERAGDGVREPGRHVGDRRRLHARPGERREEVLRRVPAERAGRGRGRRHPDAAALERRRLGHVAPGDDAGGLRGAPARAGAAREAIPRHAGPRVHDRAGEALHPADAQRQADGLRGRAHRDRHGRRGPDRAGGGRGARRARAARAAARARLSGAREGRGGEGGAAPRQGPPRGAGRRLRAHRAHGRARRRDGREGRDRGPRPRGDVAGGHRRHARRGRDPHDARRRDVPRCRRGARHGQDVRRRRGGDHGRHRARRDPGGGPLREGGRLDLGRRHRRAGHPRQDPDAAFRGAAGRPAGDDPARAVGRLSRVHPDPRVGGSAPAPRRPGERGHPDGRARRAPLRRARASGSAAPSTCSSRRSASPPCAR